MDMLDYVTLLLLEWLSTIKNKPWLLESKADNIVAFV
jgi:hypothetical protein